MPTFTKKQIGIFIGIVLMFIICIFYYKKQSDVRSVTILKSGEIEKSIVEEEYVETKNIKVYIIGEVNSPGVYELPVNSRVVDVVEKAEGFTDEADRVSINLAKILKDEEQIVVSNISNKTFVEVNNNKSDINLSSDTTLVNINKATKEQLMTLPSVGSVTAENIISYRETYGLFKSIEEIKNVTRIGEKTFESLKELISVD